MERAVTSSNLEEARGTHHGGIQPEQDGALEDGQPNIVGDDDAAGPPECPLDRFLQHGRLGEASDQEEEAHAAHLGLYHQLLCWGKNDSHPKKWNPATPSPSSSLFLLPMCLMMLVMVGWKSSVMASCVSRSIPWDDHFTMLMLKHGEDGKRHDHARVIFPHFVTFPSEISARFIDRESRRDLTCSS